MIDRVPLRAPETESEILGTRSSGAGTPIIFSLSALFRLTIGLLTVSLLVEGLLPQVEMALFNGNIPIPLSYSAYLLCALLGFSVLLDTRFSKDSLVTPAFILTAFLILDGIHLASNEGVAPIELIHSYYGFFLTLLIGAGTTAFRVRMSERLLVSIILLVFTISLAISAIQVTTNSPVIPTQSNDQTWVVNSDTFLGGQSQRAFGLFPSGLGMGLFCSFVGSLGASYCRTLRGALVGIPILLASAFGCYATLTRVAFIDLICCVATVYLISKRRWRVFVPWLPLLWAFVALITVLQAAAGEVNRSRTLANTDSVSARLQEWEASIAIFASASPLEQTLGLGMAPGNAFVSGSVQPTKHLPFPVDNIAFVLLLYVGVLGTVLAFSFFAICWMYILRRAMFGESHLHIAVAAFWSTILLAGSFNVTLGPLGALLILLALCEPMNSRRSIPALA
jgi:hypothetical protein